MTRAACIPVLRAAAMIAASLAAAPALGGGETTATYNDPAGDAALRRTDASNSSPIHPEGTVPDLLQAVLMGWQTPTPTTDPYSGSPRQGEGASLFRLDLTFDGLLNPPGPLGVGGTVFNPFAFGPSPVYGYLELNIDRERDTGGELGGAAQSRYLANVGRFGTLPESSISGRAVRWSQEIDADFSTGPQFERSGADWALALCGCHPVTIVSEGGDADGVFEAGETWIVRSRFFKRSGGFQGASGMFGGSAPGLYDPHVNLRFSHDQQTDRTTISLVWALNAAGAAALTGQSQQPYDQSIIAGNHASLAEGLRDIIIGAQGGNGGPLTGPVQTLTGEWAEESHNDEDLLDPTRWRVSALFGMPAAEEGSALFIWTDTGFGEIFADCDSDGLIDIDDWTLLSGVIDAQDGGPFDLDGVIDGVVTAGLGASWSFFDFDSNGLIDQDDLDLILSPVEECPADWDRNGIHDVADIFAFLMSWFAGEADFDGEGGTGVQDIFAFLSSWFTGCP